MPRTSWNFAVVRDPSAKPSEDWLAPPAIVSTSPENKAEKEKERQARQGTTGKRERRAEASKGKAMKKKKQGTSATIRAQK